MNEKNFLKEYDISNYERPSVATDMVIFNAVDEVNENPKKSGTKKLKILLIKRGDFPFKDKWALPGGFLKMNETLEECAVRELNEETGLEHFYLSQLGTYSTVDRDPRGRIISCAYISLINNCKDIISGGSDADDADWFEMRINEEENKFSFELLRNDEEFLRAKVTVEHDKAVVEDVKGELAFDHVQIISDAVFRVRTGFHTTDYIFSLLPKKFTIPQMQAVYSLVMGKNINKDVLHRLYDKKISKTNFTEENGQHKRAILYVKN